MDHPVFCDFSADIPRQHSLASIVVLIEINAPCTPLHHIQPENMEVRMTAQDIMLLVFFVSVFLVFGITLGFASWDETRRMQKLGSALHREPKPAGRKRVHN